MNEQEFDERLTAIKNDLDKLYNEPLVQLHKIDSEKGIVVYDTQTKKLLERIAANVIQIEEGIKRYSRPKSWELIQEGVSN